MPFTWKADHFTCVYKTVYKIMQIYDTNARMNKFAEIVKEYYRKILKVWNMLNSVTKLMCELLMLVSDNRLYKQVLITFDTLPCLYLITDYIGKY